MLTLRLVEKVLGILTLILWGSFAYIAIPGAVYRLFSYQMLPTIVAMCLPLFIPFLLLLSEGFWAKHIELTFVLRYLGGLLAALGGLVLVYFLLVHSFWPYQEKNSVFWAIWVWLLAGILLLWADAAVIFARVWREG